MTGQDWRDSAACKNEDPALFFAPDIERMADREAREASAKAICAGCPVRHDCLTFGLKQKAGHWGGLTEDEIRQLRRRRAAYARALAKETAA